MRHTISTVALLLLSVSIFAQKINPDAPKTEWYQFTTDKENPITSIKNQYRSGTCWCFSTLGFIESEVMRLNNGLEVDLSEMYIVSKSYHDRAVKYVQMDGALAFSAGSGSGDVMDVIREYGLVPQEAMPGLNYGTEKPEHGEMDAVLKNYADAIVARSDKNKLTTAWLRGYDAVLAEYLGDYPSKVSYTYKSKGKKVTEKMSPTDYRDVLGIKPDDYVCLTSFIHHPFYTEFALEVHDNWRWDKCWNVPIDELMDIMFYAVNNGFTIAWGADVSEKGFTRDGLAVFPVEKKKQVAGSDQEHWVGKAENVSDKDSVVNKIPQEVHATQEMRQECWDNKTLTDDHGMQVYGLAHDQNGTRYFIVKNSWGETGAYKGMWYVSEWFARYRTMNILVHKDGIPKEILEKLNIK